MENNLTKASNNKKRKFTLDLRIVVLLLLTAIGVMLYLWQPWNAQTNNDQTISVTGEAKLTDTPDEFVFYPTYEVKGTDKDAAIKELSNKSETVIAKLKELGAEDKKIKSSASGYDYRPYLVPESDQTTYSLQLTITLNNKELTQKVQDYLVTTEPTGSISPQAHFSDEKRRKLEDQARDEATKMARAKADQSARNLGFKIGKVKSVYDASGFGVMPIDMRSMNGAEATDTSKLTVQPGENELHYSVTVVYYIK